MKKTVIIIMTVLSVIILITAYLNRDYAAGKSETESKAEFIIRDNGKIVATVNLNDIKAAGTENFRAVLKTNEKEPEYYNYDGCQLKDLFKAYNIDISKRTAVILKAVDGYSIAYTVQEVMAEKNAYLVYAEEGKLLGGRKEGGRGPYQVIIVSDQFSNRRCKHAVEMDTQ